MTTSGMEDRKYWIRVMDMISRPVLTALSRGTLKQTMPVEAKTDDRPNFTYLEALGRTLAGIAPWIELGKINPDEDKLRNEYAELARSAIDSATDPLSPDYMNFSNKFGDQPVVDAAFLAHAILRAPTELWEKLECKTKRNLVKALKDTRSCKTHFNNWLLFAAMIETALFKMGEEWDAMRVDYALMQHEQWYMGDGIYGDGPEFHWDYYNSFVIHPMLVDIITTMSDIRGSWKILKEKILSRAVRYAEIQERLISPEATFPAIGRSLAYRFGVFQHLAQMALKKMLPEKVAPSQVRCALTAVIKRIIEQPGTFDENGWLKIGLCGSQPDIGENYISTGSLYLCTTVFLPLGLSPQEEFWSGEPQEWTSRKIWSGQNIGADHALSGK